MVSKRILIIDDDQDIRDFLGLFLQERGYSIAKASNGNEALWEILREKPHLILLDLMLPEMSGEHVLQVIKNDPALREIVVFVISARNEVDVKTRCLKLGAEQFLAKPLEMEEVVARIERFFSNSRISNSSDSSHNSANTQAIEPSSSQTNPSGSGEGKSRYGPYRIESLAGSGGMGLVYKCHDPQLDRYVAVKVLSDRWTSSEEFLERFRREAKLLAAINHPGIAHVYTFAEEDGKAFFALQWCSGGSLANRIKQEKRIGLMQAIDIVLQCVRALVAASLKGVVHRDIKPSNIMFDENQQVKLVDFGIAHVETVSAKVTIAGELIGSPAYMAPEQGKAIPVDHRTDIYALGITFYYMLYGRLPFRAKTPIEWVIKHATEPFPQFEDGERVPLRAYEIIKRMTQKDPAERYQTYVGLISDLERLRKELFSRSELKIPRAQDISSTPNLRQESYFELLSELNRRQSTGVLKVSWGPLQKRFLLHHNDLVLYESPQPDENFWAAMVQRGLMSKELIPAGDQDLEESLNHLLFIQAFSPEDFNIIYREMMYSSVLQVFLWPLLEGEFYSASIEHDAFGRIPISRILLEGARTMIPHEVILSRIPRDQFIVPTPTFRIVLESLNLPRAENFLASRLEGERCTLNMLQLLTGFPLEQIVRFVYALKGLGAVEYRKPSEFRPRRNLEDTSPGVRTSNITTPAKEKRQQEISMPDLEKTSMPVAEEASRPVVEEITVAEASFQLAEQKYEQGEYGLAEKLCTRAIQENPGEAKYHRLRAMALGHYPHYGKKAEESFRAAIRLDPGNADYHVELALFLRRRGHMVPAILECERALEIAPRHKRARKLLRELEG